MTNEQVDRLLGLLERYVYVQELRLVEEAAELKRRAQREADRKVLEERAVRAQEEAAKGQFVVSATAKQDVTLRQAPPQTGGDT